MDNSLKKLFDALRFAVYFFIIVFVVFIIYSVIILY